MLILKNIKREGNTISAVYEPEGCKKAGRIKINYKTGEILESEDSDGYGKWHAVKELMRLAERQDLPDERIVLWY